MPPIRARGGLGYGVLAFGLMLLAGALFWALVDPAVQTTLNVANNQTTNQAALDSQSLTRQIWDLSLYYVLFVSALYFVAKSVFESEVR